MADFGTLAQLTKPQMMPNAPSPIAGAMYGQDMKRNDDALAGLAELAKLQAMQEAMKAEEASLGQPGRKAEIQLKNVASQDNLDAYSTGGMGRQNAFGAVEGKNLENEKKMKEFLQDYFNTLGGEDEEKAKAAYDTIISKVPKLANVSYEQMRKSAQAEMYGKTKADPKQINKMEQETLKQEGSLAKEFMKQQGANTRQEKDLITKREIAKLKASNPKLHDLLLQKNNGDLDKMFNDLLLLKIAPTMQAGQNQADLANSILPPDKRVPDVRAAPALVSGSSSTATEPKVGNVWQASKDKKGKILGVRRQNGKIVELNVEGIGIVPYK